MGGSVLTLGKGGGQSMGDSLDWKSVDQRRFFEDTRKKRWMKTWWYYSDLFKVLMLSNSMLTNEMALSLLFDPFEWTRNVSLFPFSRISNSQITSSIEFEAFGERNECPWGLWSLKRGGLRDPTSTGEGNECQRGRWAPKESGLWDPTSVGEGNEAFFIRIWKYLPSRHVLKTLRGSPKRTISASGGLGLLHIYSGRINN